MAYLLEQVFARVGRSVTGGRLLFAVLFAALLAALLAGCGTEPDREALFQNRYLVLEKSAPYTVAVDGREWAVGALTVARLRDWAAEFGTDDFLVGRGSRFSGEEMLQLLQRFRAAGLRIYVMNADGTSVRPLSY